MNNSKCSIVQFLPSPYNKESFPVISEVFVGAFREVLRKLWLTGFKVHLWKPDIVCNGTGFMGTFCSQERL